MKDINFKFKILFLVLVFCSRVIAVNYPSSTGYVNDFAKILPENIKSELENMLSDYEKQTSIKIAVVTTPSLDDISIDEWTLGLATKWGVGKKGKDNGLVIAVAPNERKIKIEVGYGLEGDLPDGKCGRILDEFAIPSFRDNNYPQGITRTVSEVIRQLGTKTSEERVAEKARLEEERKKAKEEALQVLKWIVLVALFMLPILVMVLKIVGAIERKKREIREAEEMKQGVAEGLENLPKKIAQLKREHTKSMEIFETLKLENPRENWKDLVSSAATIAGIFVAAAGLLESARKKNTAEKIELVKAHEEIKQTEKELSKIDNIFADIFSRQKEIKKAKESYEKNLAQSEKEVKEALELAEKKKKQEAKTKANKAKEELDKAKKLVSAGGLIDWLAVSLLLLSAVRLSKEAKNAATYVKIKSVKRKDDEDHYLSSYHNSQSSFHSGRYSSSTHSNFGGFGGGGFGGGGASRGW